MTALSREKLRGLSEFIRMVGLHPRITRATEPKNADRTFAKSADDSPLNYII